jgi:nicotinamidase-related amidase
MKPALLVIDLQRWFSKSPDRQSEWRHLVESTNQLIDFFYGERLPIIHIVTVHQADGSTGDLWMKRNNSVSLVEGTPDAEELPEVHTCPGDVTVTKTRHSAFIRTQLEEVLRGMQVDTVVLTGYSTNACVGLTAIDAYERDFDVLIAAEATLGINASRTEAMLQVLRHEYGFEAMPISRIMEEVCSATARS